MLAGPIFRSGGLLTANATDGLHMLLWNVIGMACIVAWNAGTSIVLFGSLHMVGVLRVKQDVEEMGLDADKHDETAYPECKNYANEKSAFISTLFCFLLQLSDNAFEHPYTILWFNACLL